MDVISNNIANASTSGYRAGDFVFEDQFYKAFNPLDKARAGMGDAKANIRRFWNMGAISASQNSLDMAILGSNGMYRLTSNVNDPAATYYSRNGQFAISKEVDPSYPKRSYIVNENGMFLTGYSSVDGKTLSNTHTNRLAMPPISIDPVTTSASTVSVTLDARQTAFIPEGNVKFDPQVPSSYTNKISQTVYHLGDSGNPHTMELYYRRVEDKNMTVSYDGTYLRYEPNSIADPTGTTDPQGATVANNKAFVVLTPESSGPEFKYLTSANRKTNATTDLTSKSYINVNVNADIKDLARVIVNGKDTGVVSKAVDTVAVYASAITTPAGSNAAEISKHTITHAAPGLLKAGDVINFQIKGKVYNYTITAADITGGTPQNAAATAIAASLTTDKASLGLTSATTNGGEITLTASSNNDLLLASAWSTRGAQSTGAISTTRSATADAATAEISTITLSGTYTRGDRISVSLQGLTYTYTVTGSEAADPLANSIVANVQALIDAEKTALGVSLTTPIVNSNITITAANKNDPLDISVSVNKAIQLSSDITVKKDDEVTFFNPVTTAYPGAAVTTASKTITVATSDTSIQTGQYLWKKSKAGVFTQLDAKVLSVSSKTLTLDKEVTLAKDDQIVFYQPVTYTVMTQDGSKVQMTGEHKRSASSSVPQLFTAITSQVEVYGSLDGTMFNALDSRFSSDTAITPTIQGVYKPLATMQFWGGQNIDALRFDAVTGKPAFESKVQLKGVVTSSGKTNGPGGKPISEDHPLEFNLDLTGTRHFATSFSVDSNFQNGSPTALLSNVTIDKQGKLVGSYTDGREFLAGQLVLVHFAAVNGLAPTGANSFQTTAMSGNEISEGVVVGKPGERGLGEIKAAALEGSNVDLAAELVKLLVQQRMYSANSQSIRAFDEALTQSIRMVGG
jgi:flagellar hook-basal body protein